MSPKAFAALFAGFLVGLATSVATASRNSSGVYTLPSGNPVVAGTVISDVVHNTTMGDVATELTNSLDRQGRGAMQAQLKGISGNVGAPSFTFSGDTDNGLYRASTNVPAMSADGTLVQDWTSQGTRLYDAGVFGNLSTTSNLGDGGVFPEANRNQLTAVPATNFVSYGMGTYRTSQSGNNIGLTARVRVDGGSGWNGLEVGWSYDVDSTIGAGASVFLSQNSVKLSKPLRIDATDPASTAGSKNTLHASNIVKAWARVSSGGAGASSVLGGFNVASVSEVAPSAIRVTLAESVPTSYAVVVTGEASRVFCATTSQATGSFDVQCWNDVTAAILDPLVNTFTFSAILIGAQ